VLDSEGLAKAVLRTREVTQWLALARADDLRVITSAATVVEVAHPRLSRPALEWTLSRVVVEPVTEPIARRATAILAEAGLHGHRHAIDAMLSATALAAPGPVTVLTSDPEDIATLCGRNVTVIKVLRDGPGAKRAGSAATRPIGTPCPRLWQAFAERGGEAELGAQPFGVDGSLAARSGEPCLVFELAQQALQPKCLCRVALGSARCGAPRGIEVQYGHGLFQPGYLPFPCRRSAIGHWAPGKVQRRLGLRLLGNLRLRTDIREDLQ
jgi:predicted nucleic acid-binding protein